MDPVYEALIAGRDSWGLDWLCRHGLRKSRTGHCGACNAHVAKRGQMMHARGAMHTRAGPAIVSTAATPKHALTSRGVEGQGLRV